MNANVSSVTMYATDPDRAQSIDLITSLRQRFDGRYLIDPFGADPQLQDVLAPVVLAAVRTRVEHGERLIRNGPALLVSNRGFGVVEPTALTVAVRCEIGRRLRIVGVPDIPVLGDMMRKLGGVIAYPGDVGALLRAGHMAAVPLGSSWSRWATGRPPLPLLVPALGYPVIPVAVMPGGPFGLPLRPWRVVVGEPLPILSKKGSGDPLAAAELAEAARTAIDTLISGDSNL